MPAHVNRQEIDELVAEIRGTASTTGLDAVVKEKFRHFLIYSQPSILKTFFHLTAFFVCG